jgi:hypothetical protein
LTSSTVLLLLTAHTSCQPAGSSPSLNIFPPPASSARQGVTTPITAPTPTIKLLLPSEQVSPR